MSITWRGPWNSATNYDVGDAVSVNGSSYVALITNSNQSPPTSSSAWDVLAQAGDSAFQPLLGVENPNTLASIGSGMATGCIVGQIFLFPYRAGAPNGVSEANGQILMISQNTTLFSLLGTTYGGDGQTTFALPDLRALAPNNMQYMICLFGVFP